MTTQAYLYKDDDKLQTARRFSIRVQNRDDLLFEHGWETVPALRDIKKDVDAKKVKRLSQEDRLAIINAIIYLRDEPLATSCNLVGGYKVTKLWS